jgi:hypothetical protein
MVGGIGRSGHGAQAESARRPVNRPGEFLGAVGIAVPGINARGYCRGKRPVNGPGNGGFLNQGAPQSGRLFARV